MADGTELLTPEQTQKQTFGRYVYLTGLNIECSRDRLRWIKSQIAEIKNSIYYLKLTGISSERISNVFFRYGDVMAMEANIYVIDMFVREAKSNILGINNTVISKMFEDEIATVVGTRRVIVRKIKK